MTTPRYILLFSIAAILICCGGDKTDESMKVKKRSEKVSLSDIKAPQSDEKILNITEVKFGSLIDVQNDLTATPVLLNKEAVEEYTFRWFVNDTEISGENNAVLSREYFRIDDWIHCRIEIIDENAVYPEFVSKRVRIKGPLPELNLKPPEEFKPPGIFRYEINAKMPDIENFEPDYGDEDEIDPEKALKFELVSPLDKGIELDTITGEITWDITEELLNELGEKIMIKFSVISPSGRKINSSITINLKEVEEENNNSDNNSTLGKEIE